MKPLPSKHGLPILVSLFVCAIPAPSHAQSLTSAPDGTGTLVNQVGNTIDITGGTQAGSNLFHSFQTFGLDAGQIANFLANPAIQNILGRVTGGEASVINGLMQVTGSNANLYLMNPAGIIFGANASLNVPGSFTATTANGIWLGSGEWGAGSGGWFNAIGTNDYANLMGTPSSFAFTALQPGAIINAGNLAVGQGQSLTLLGGTVINTGTLTASGGSVTVAAIPGEKLVRVTQHGSLLSLDLPVADKATLNSSPLTPLSLPALLTGSNLGNATGVSVDTNGTVRLTGSNTAIPVEAGTAIASNQLNAAGVIGGKVTILGNKVGLVGASIDASGVNGGGTVLIGGDYQGNGTIPNAQQTYVSPDSVIRVDALQTGDGGRAIVWADGTTQFFGTIHARGGSQSGNGGFVEVSGKQNLTFDGGVDVQAPAGAAGQLLLDPTSVVIGTDGTNDNQLDDRQILASDPGGTFFISAARVVQALSTGNVAIAAGINIDVNSTINATANTNTASLTLTAPQINLNESIQLANGDITLNGNVSSNAPPNPNPFLVGRNFLNTTNGNVTINGTLNSSNDTGLDLTASGAIRVTGEIGNTSNLRYVQFRSANTVTLNNYSGANRLDADFVGQLRLESPGDMTISTNIFTSGVDQIQISAGNNLTVLDNYLSARSNLDLSAGNTLTVDNASLDNNSPEASLQIQGPTVNILGSRSSGYRDVTIQGQTVNIQSTIANPVNVIAQRSLTLNAQNSLQVQDGANPVLLQAEGNLTAQGNATVSLQMLNQPQSVLRSGSNLAVISDGTIAADARILSEGNLVFLNTSGAPGNISLSPLSSLGIISSAGDVTFGNYEGPSLKVEARGSIQGGNITITGANTTLQGSDPEIAILSSIPSVILRAGLGELQTSTDAYPNTEQLRNTPTVPPDRAAGGTIFTATSTPSAGTITIGTISTPTGSSGISNFQSGKQVILSATDSITTGDITAGSGSVALSTTRGNIKAGDIRTTGFSGYSGVSLSAPAGNIEISTIDTGAAGIDIMAGGTFRAIGSKTESFDGFGSAFTNNPDLIDYLVAQGFDRQQLLDAGVELVPPFSPRPPVRFSLMSRPGGFIVDKPRSPITLRYGDQSQVILDRPNGFGSRILILGDSQQKFRMGPIPQDNLPFIPANPSDRLQDYNPITNNFSFAFNASVPLTYPSEQFPAGASGLAAGITVGAGGNSSLYGSAQYRVFDPTVVVRSIDPEPLTNGGVNQGSTTIGTGGSSISREAGQVAQKDLNRQTQAAICSSPTTIASQKLGDKTRDRAALQQDTIANDPCSTSDDEEILKILEDDPSFDKELMLKSIADPEQIAPAQP